MDSTCVAQESPLPKIQIAEGGKYFETESQKPFFYLADTAWTIATRLRMDEAEVYLQDRRQKGFNVIQLALVPWDARYAGNLDNVLPFHDDDTSKPNEEYFANIDQLLDLIQSYNMYPAVVPFWLAGAPAPDDQAVLDYQAYARFLGARYGHREMFWLLGADRRVDDGWNNVIRAFAIELETASGRPLMITHHPQGGQSSSSSFHDDTWLDFNMLQSGHNLSLNHYSLIERDFAGVPSKPVLDGEPAYENVANALVKIEKGVHIVNADDVRRQAYQSVFSGAAGHAYGCSEVYEFHREGMKKAPWVIGIPWKEALQLPGAKQVCLMKSLIDEYSHSPRVPDPRLIASPNPESIDRHLVAVRGFDNSYAMIYSPQGEPFQVNLQAMGGHRRLTATWFDPRTGKTRSAFRLQSPRNIVPCKPPSNGPGRDWVLTIVDPTMKKTASASRN